MLPQCPTHCNLQLGGKQIGAEVAWREMTRTTKRGLEAPDRSGQAIGRRDPAMYLTVHAL